MHQNVGLLDVINVDAEVGILVIPKAAAWVQRVFYDGEDVSDVVVLEQRRSPERENSADALARALV